MFIPVMNGKHQINVPEVLAFLQHPELQVSLSNPEKKRVKTFVRAVFKGVVNFSMIKIHGMTNFTYSCTW